MKRRLIRPDSASVQDGILNFPGHLAGCVQAVTNPIDRPAPEKYCSDTLAVARAVWTDDLAVKR